MPREPSTSFTPEVIIQVQQDVQVQTQDNGEVEDWVPHKNEPIFAE